MKASASHKVSLAILALAVLALLAPYVGCHGPESDREPSSTLLEDPENPAPSRRSKATEQSLDPIEEILSN